MKKRNIFYTLASLCLAFTAVSCSSGSDIDVPEWESTQKRDVYLTSLKPQVRVFEACDFLLGSKLPNSEALSKVLVDFDSATVSIDGYSLYLNKKGKELTRWSQAFNKPGDVKCVAIGYRGGREASRAETTIHVAVPEGDFLSLYWDQSKQDFKTLNCLSNLQNIALDLQYSDRITKHATLSYRVFELSENESENLKVVSASKKFLTDYINSIYQDAKFTYEGADITQSTLVKEYNSRFALPLNKIEDNSSNQPFYPLAIWETPRANVALVAYEHNYGANGVAWCRVIAEPKQ